MSDSDLVELDGVTVAYGGGQSLFGRRREPIVAVDNVSLAMPKGQSTGVVGGTGAGKSTVAKLVMGMVAPTSGSVRVAGHDVAARGSDRLQLQRLRQVVMQDPYSSLDSRMSVRDIIAEPLTLGRRVRRAEIDARVEELLTMVGLPPSRAPLYPHQFSGGQRQRISIARALAPQPELIVLDEPTSALDVSVRAQILLLLKRLQDQLGVTYLIISHDMVTVAYLASNVAVMSAGRVVEAGPTTQLFRSPEHAYTRELLASMPTTPGSWLEQLDAPTVLDPAPIGGTA